MFADSFDSASIYTISTSTSSFGDLVDDKDRCFRKLTKNAWFENISNFELTTTDATAFVLDNSAFCESPQPMCTSTFELVQPTQVVDIEHGPAFRRTSTTPSCRNLIIDEKEITYMCEVAEVTDAAIETSTPAARASVSGLSKEGKVGAWIRRVLRV
jgi:hypothetical protein